MSEIRLQELITEKRALAARYKTSQRGWSDQAAFNRYCTIMTLIGQISPFHAEAWGR